MIRVSLLVRPTRTMLTAKSCEFVQARQGAPETLCSPWPPSSAKVLCMKVRFTYWKESDGRYLGYLNDYPDHWTQGENLEDLKEHLKDLFHTFNAEQIPGIRKVEELEVLEAARPRRSLGAFCCATAATAVEHCGKTDAEERPTRQDGFRQFFHSFSDLFARVFCRTFPVR